MLSATAEQNLAREIAMLESQLTTSLKAQDWERVRELDLRVRESLQAIGILVKVGPELEQAKQRLRELYAQVIPAYTEAGDKLRQLLENHIEHADGRSAYLRTSLLQGGQ